MLAKQLVSAIKSFQVEVHTGNFFSEKKTHIFEFLIMIDAIIFNGFSTHQFSVLSFCEKAELVSMSNGSESYEKESFQLYMRHAFSFEAQLGTTVGCHDQRRIFLVDGACDGKKCNCRTVAWQFLEGNLSREEIPISIRDSVGHFPVNAVIFDEEGCWWISSFSFGDTVIQPIRDGAYSFANGTLGMASDNDLEIVSALYSESRNSRTSTEVACRTALGKLHNSIQYWPTPATGICLSLHDFEGQVTCCTLDPQILISKAEPSFPRPKGPITGFNFFSKMSRKRVYEEMQEGSSNLSTNELNKILGQRWRSMSTAEKSPFLAFAENDRQRYLQEMEDYKKLMDPASNIKETRNRPSKPLTAYNLFVHQEKQFVMGCEVSDTQSRIGKHGGDRWSAMPFAEKDLYKVLHEVGARDYL